MGLLGPHRFLGGFATGVVVAVAVVQVVALGLRPPADPPTAVPEPAYEPRFTAETVAHVTEPVLEQVADSAFPGAALAIGIGAFESKGIGMGNIGWTSNAAPVDPDSTMYDLASLTKVVATATAVMLLVDDGQLRLDDPIGDYLPEFREGPKAEVTVRHLLSHTSGLPEGADFLGEDRQERLARAAGFSIYPPAGAREQYSDVGYVLLWEVAERAAGEPLQRFLQRRLYDPLRMNSTGFLPGLDCERCAPTGRLRDQSLYRGRPFDPIAQRLDGIAGNAGLFSTAADLGRFAAMIANGGELDGVRVLSAQAVREFTSVQTPGHRHGLGWEIRCTVEMERGGDSEDCSEPAAISHTGWTGTSIHVDLATGAWVVLLTNRTYEPRAPNRLGRVRAEVFSRAIATTLRESPGSAESQALPAAD